MPAHADTEAEAARAELDPPPSNKGGSVCGGDTWAAPMEVTGRCGREGQGQAQQT